MNPLINFLLYVSLTFPSAAIMATESAQSGSPAPNCALTSLDNTQHYQLQQFKGKVVYVDFWASWCNSCVKSFPYLNELEHELKEKGLQVLAVNMDEVREEAQTFLDKHPAHFTVAADNNAQCAKDFGVKAMPTSYLVDRNGVIRRLQLGFRSEEAKEFRGMVEQLLAENQTAH